MLLFFNQFILPALILAAIGAFFGVMIAICSKLFYVKVDKRVEEITQMLPGYNCGVCGSPGCSGHAQRIISGEAKIEACKPSKPDQIAAIKAYYEEHKND